MTTLVPFSQVSSHAQRGVPRVQPRASTVARYTETFDSCTLAVQFADGSSLRLFSSRRGDRITAKGGIDRPTMSSLFNAFGKMTTNPNEAVGARYRRAKVHFEKYRSAAEAAAAL